MDIKNILEKINIKKVIRIAAVSIVIIVAIIIVGTMIKEITGKIASQKIRMKEATIQNKDEKFSALLPDQDNLKIPEEYARNPIFSWRAFRETPEKWSEEETTRFWKEPADIIIETYKDENKKAIDRILEEVP